MEWLGWIDNHPTLKLILMALGAIVVLAQVVVFLTPSKKDDEALDKLKSIPVLGKILSFLESFAPIKKVKGDKDESKPS